MAIWQGVKRISMGEWGAMVLGFSLLYWVMVKSLPLQSAMVLMFLFAVSILSILAFLKSTTGQHIKPASANIADIINDLSLFDDQLLILTNLNDEMVSCSQGYKSFFDQDLPSPKQFLSAQQSQSLLTLDEHNVIQCTYQDKSFAVKMRQTGLL